MTSSTRATRVHNRIRGHNPPSRFRSVTFAEADRFRKTVLPGAVQRSGDQQQKSTEGGGLAIAIGSLLDGVPESVVLGLGLLAGQGISTAMLAAIFLSNLPEGLSSALGMKRAGRSKTYVFGIWIGIAALSGLASLLGAALLGGASPQVLAAVNAVAAGALLTMIANTMIPEAVEGEHKATGVLVVLGLLVAFALSNMGAA